jgi:hypothetical protein
MAVNFPANPTVGQQLVVGATVREWSGVAWVSMGTRTTSIYMNVDGGSASSVYTLRQAVAVDGGSANSVYTSDQTINGGTAGSF